MPNSRLVPVTQFLIALLAVLPHLTSRLDAQPVSVEGPLLVAPEIQPAEESRPSTESLNDLMTAIVLEHMPHDFEDAKRWGQQKEVNRGIRFSGKGLKIKAERRKKQVNHGTWKKYRISQINPEKHFRVQIENLRASDDGRTAFDAVFRSNLHACARLSEWQQGVRLVSVSTDAEATIRLQLDCRVGFELDSPDVVFMPEVIDAQLDLLDFRVLRISKLKGSLAEQLGRRLRKKVEQKLDDKRKDLVKSINREIEENQDKLRLSPKQLAESKWEDVRELVQRWLP